VRLGILITGDTSGELNAQYGSFAAMFVALFKGQKEQFEYAYYDIRDNEFPLVVDECDGWLITGSEHGVYDQLPWMEPLQQFIRAVSDTTIPMIGICFGHQIMAAALGGQVAKSERGWGLGLHRYEVTGKDDAETVVINAMHQDQVMSLPQNAEVFLSSPFCPYAGLYYGPRMMSIQAHPEFSSEFTVAQMEALKGRVFPEDLTEQAVAALTAGGTQPDTARVTRWMIDLLRTESV